MKIDSAPRARRRVFLAIFAVGAALLPVWFVYRYFGPIRHDSQEADTIKGPIIRRVLRESDRQVVAEFEQKYGGRRLGMCHRVWHVAKTRLREEYQIDWRTPAEMNPFVAFD